jgi:hypothetical protein
MDKSTAFGSRRSRDTGMCGGSVARYPTAPWGRERRVRDSNPRRGDPLRDSNAAPSAGLGQPFGYNTCVELSGLEPLTFGLPNRCSTELSYSPDVE